MSGAGRYLMLAATLAGSNSALAKTDKPKFASIDDLATSIRCQVAQFSADAAANHVPVKTIKGKVTFKVTDKTSLDESVSAAIPFDIVEIAPSVSRSSAGTHSAAIEYSLELVPDQKVPAICAETMVKTYDRKGRPSAPASVSPLWTFARLEPYASVTPAAINQSGDFTTSATLGAGVSIKILFIKIKVGPAETKSSSGSYDVTFLFGKDDSSVFKFTGAILGAKPDIIPTPNLAVPSDAIPVVETHRCIGMGCM